MGGERAMVFRLEIKKYIILNILCKVGMVS